MILPPAFEACRRLFAIHLTVTFLSAVEALHGHRPRLSDRHCSPGQWRVGDRRGLPYPATRALDALLLLLLLLRKGSPIVAVVVPCGRELCLPVRRIVAPGRGLLGAAGACRRPRAAGRGAALPLTLPTTPVIRRSVPRTRFSPVLAILRRRALTLEHGGAELDLPLLCIRGGVPRLRRPPFLPSLRPPLGARSAVACLPSHRVRQRKQKRHNRRGELGWRREWRMGGGGWIQCQRVP